MANDAGAAGVRAPLLTLLSRTYCHLCEDMREALAPIARRHGATVVEVDVDADPALERAHGDRVPVLFLGAPGDGQELCHYHLAAETVERALSGDAR